MKIIGMCLSGQAGWSEQRLAEIDNGLNVFIGPRGSGKTTIAQLPADILCGYQRRSGGHNGSPDQAAVRAPGTLEIADRLGHYLVHRDDDGSTEGRLTITRMGGAAANGETLRAVTQYVDSCTLRSLLLPNLDLDARFDSLLARPFVRDLLALGGHAFSCSLDGAGDSLDGEGRAGGDCRQSASLPVADNAAARCDQLVRRRRTIASQLRERLARRRRRGTELDKALDRVQREISRIRDRLSEIQREMSAVAYPPDATMARPLLETPTHWSESKPSLSATGTDDWECQLDERIAYWEQILDNLVENNNRDEDHNLVEDHGVAAARPGTDHARQPGANPCGPSDPRQYLGALEQLLGELQTEVNRLDPSDESSMCACLHAHPRLARMVVLMRQQVYAMCDALNCCEPDCGQEVWLADLEQLATSRGAIAGHIEFLCRQRAIVRQQSARFESSASGHDRRAVMGRCRCRHHARYRTEQGVVAGPSADYFAASAQDDRRGRLANESASLERTLGDWNGQLQQLQRERSELANDPAQDELRAELLAIQQQLDHELRQRSVVLEHASRLLAGMTANRLSEIHTTAERDQLRIAGHAVESVAIAALGSGDRQQVALALHMALTAAAQLRGLDLPLVLDEPFRRMDAAAVGATAAALVDFARRGHQVLLFTENDMAIACFRQAGVAVHSLPARGNAAQQAPAQGSQVPAFQDGPAPGRLPDNSEIVTLRDEAAYDPSPSPGSDASPARHAWLGRPLQHVFHGPGDRSRARANRATPVGLASLSFIPRGHQEALRRAGIIDVADLLEADVERLAATIANQGLPTDLLRGWQSWASLMHFVPILSARDARLLAAVGIDDPERLAAADIDELYDRLQRFLRSPRGHRFARWADSYDRGQVQRWIERARRGASRWRLHHRPGGRVHSRPASLSAENRARAENSYPVQAENTSADMIAGAVPMVPQAVETTSRDGAPSTPARAKTTGRFYLDLDRPVVDAPSIGPKTAERLKTVGIHLVGDLLRANPEQTAAQLAYRRIKGDTIRLWQHQARLVCQIPQLRGHDAQILVACGVTEAAALAAMDPRQLDDVVSPFVESKEGQRLVRSSKKPDLEEITDWISWASQARPLAA